MNLKELLKDESKRKIVLLCMYLLMMFVIILVVRINPGNAVIKESETVTKTDVIVDTVSALDKLKYTNYQYDYNITYNEENYIIKGTRYNEEELFSYNNKNYFLKQNEVYEIDGYRLIGTNADASFFYKFKSEKIYDLLNSLTPSLELNVDNEIQKEYQTSINEETFNIKTYEKDKYINKVEIKNITNGLNININYSNVNKVSKLNTNFIEE